MKRRAKSMQPSSTVGTTASQQGRRRRAAWPQPADLEKNLDVVGDIDSRIRRHTNGNERVKANQ